MQAINMGSAGLSLDGGFGSVVGGCVPLLDTATSTTAALVGARVIASAAMTKPISKRIKGFTLTPLLCSVATPT